MGTWGSLAHPVRVLGIGCPGNKEWDARQQWAGISCNFRGASRFSPVNSDPIFTYPVEGSDGPEKGERYQLIA